MKKSVRPADRVEIAFATECSLQSTSPSASTSSRRARRRSMWPRSHVQALDPLGGFPRRGTGLQPLGGPCIHHSRMLERLPGFGHQRRNVQTPTLSSRLLTCCSSRSDAGRRARSDREAASGEGSTPAVVSHAPEEAGWSPFRRAYSSGWMRLEAVQRRVQWRRLRYVTLRAPCVPRCCPARRASSRGASPRRPAS